jgi:hypothetical protein
MEGPTITASESSSATSTKNAGDSTLFIVVHNIHHMRLEFPPPPNHIIPTTIWDRVVTKLRMLGLKFIYKSIGNTDNGRFHEFKHEQEENYPIVAHHEYNIHTKEFKHARDGAQEKYAQEMDPILGKVITFPGDRNFVQEEIASSIQKKANKIIDDQSRQSDVCDLSDMIASNSESLIPNSMLDNANIIVAVFLLWWIFISIAMIRSYLSYYHQRMSALTRSQNQQSSSYNSGSINLITSGTRYRRIKASENQDNYDDKLEDENQ